jgi:LysR family transcriptional regulator, regulator for bpeEF and oprC
MKPDTVGAMWAFVRVVEAGSLSAAARELGITPSGVSKQLSRLEARLGVRLMQRTTRQVRPTESGTALYQRCRHLFDALDDAEESARSLATKLAGTIRLTASSALGRAHVVPALAEFAVEHPNVDFELTLTGRRVDLVGEGIDIAIREGALADSGLIATRLTEFGIALCASADYLARRPAPRAPADLAAHDFLSIESATLESELIAAAFRVERVEMRSRFRVNDLVSLRDLALAGCGIAALPIYLIDDALAARRLVRVLEQVALPRIPVTALCPDRRYQPHRVRVLLDFLKQRFRRTL